MATTPLTGIVLPNTGSTDQVPADLLTAFDQAEKFFVGRYASTTDRDTKITSPTQGMVAYTTAGNFYWWYSGATQGWLYLGGSPPAMIAFPGNANWNVVGVAAYALPRYYLDGNGIVRGQGVIQYTGSTVSGPTMGTLPVGYRPLNHTESVILGCTGAGSLATYQAEIRTTGDVVVIGSVAAGTNFFLNTLMFNPNN